MSEAAPPAHRDQPAGQAAVVHVPGEMPVDPLEPLRVKAHLGRVDLGLQPAHAAAFPARATGSPGQPRQPPLAPILRSALARVQCAGPPGRATESLPGYRVTAGNASSVVQGAVKAAWFASDTVAPGAGERPRPEGGIQRLRPAR